MLVRLWKEINSQTKASELSLIYFHVFSRPIQKLPLDKLFTVNYLLNCSHNLLRTTWIPKNETFHFKHKSPPVPYPITFNIYNKTQQIDGLFYIHIELPISVYLECRVDMEFNCPGLKIMDNGYSTVLCKGSVKILVAVFWRFFSYPDIFALCSYDTFAFCG